MQSSQATSVHDMSQHAQNGMLLPIPSKAVSVQAEMSEDEGHSQGGSDDDADEDGDLVQCATI